MSKPNVSAERSSFAAGYWNESRRPLVSLLFVAPMLAAYEGGLLLLGPSSMRNGADVWLREFLERIGFSQYFLLPLLTCGILLGWHHLQRDKWTVRSVVLYGMVLESVALAAGLLLLAEWQSSWFASPTTRAVLFLPTRSAALGKVVAYLGAGIYEELLFRLMLLPLCATVLRGCGVSRRTSLISAVILGSLVFAAAHYRIEFVLFDYTLGSSSGESWDMVSFVFRVLAGGVFSLLFIYRGFGIAAGTHALYDIFVGAL